MKRKREYDPSDAADDKEANIETRTMTALPLRCPAVIEAVSKSQEGKSYFIKYVCYCLRDEIDYAVAISSTAFDEKNLPFIPDRFKFTSWPGEKTKECPIGKTKQAITNLIREQMKIPRSRRPLVCIIIEDEFKSLQDPLIASLGERPFHYNVLLIIAANWVNKIATTLREGAWQVALFKMTSRKSIEAAYDAYGEDVRDLKEFEKLLRSCTGEYRFLFKDLKGIDMGWKCCICPPEIPEFMLEPKISTSE